MLFDGFKFILVDKLKELQAKEWIMLTAAAALIAVIVLFLVQRKKTQKTQADTSHNAGTTLIMVHGALCISLAFVLSYIKLFSMPLGGSITLASMLPLMLYSNRYGIKWGMLAGLVYGILQYIQGGYIAHWVQFLLDYPIAFAVIGLGGLTCGKHNLVLSVLIGGTARFIAHLISGMLVYGEYVMIGADAVTGIAFGTVLSSNFIVSFTYNAPYMFADIAICAIIALIPSFGKAVGKALHY